MLGRGRARLRQRRAPGHGRHRRRRRHRRAGGGEPARRRRGRRLADRRRRRARPLGRGRRDHVRARRCGCSPPTTRTETLLLVSKPPAREVVRAARARSTSAASASSPRSSAGTAATRRSRSTPTLDAGAFAAAGAQRAAGLDELEAAVDAQRAGGRLLGPVLRRLARARGGDDPRARARRDRRQRRPRRTATAHAIFDLGEEEYTQGRPHPMVDLEVRLGMLERAAGATTSAASCSTS